MPLSEEKIKKYFAQIRRIEEHREAGAEKKIRRIYKALLKDLRDFLGDYYASYAEDDILSYDILQRKASYARFLEEVEQRINGLTVEAAAEITAVVEETYKAVYAGLIKTVVEVYAVSKVVEAAEAAEIVRYTLGPAPDVVKRAVMNPISGLTLNDVLEKNRKEVIYNIKQELNIGLMNGDRYSTMARRITDKVDISYRKAITTARTETHRVREAGFLDAAQEYGKAIDASGSDLVYVKIWRTMKDERVRPQRPAYKRKAGVKPRKKYTAGLRSSLSGANHVIMEGKVVKYDDVFELNGGATAPAPSQSGVAAHDVNCRCFLEYELMTTAEYEEATGKKLLDDDATRKLMDENGIPDLKLEQTKDAKRFDNAIVEAKKANPNGGSVDTHPLDELKTFKNFLAKNDMAGVAVKPDGDITAVFKNSKWKQKGAVNDLIITARINGGTKMDCYGQFLVNAYEKCGYVPVARIPFNADYVTDPLLLQQRPDVYAMMKNTDSIETVIKKNASNAYKLSSQEMLDNLPTFEDYDEALKYRDDLLKKQESIK